jgi:hypothetical protein
LGCIESLVCGPRTFEARPRRTGWAGLSVVKPFPAQSQRKNQTDHLAFVACLNHAYRRIWPPVDAVTDRRSPHSGGKSEAASATWCGHDAQGRTGDLSRAAGHRLPTPLLAAVRLTTLIATAAAVVFGGGGSVGSEIICGRWKIS